MGWTCAEPGVIFTCACMPALWSIIRKMFNLKTGTRNKHSNNIGSERRKDKQVSVGSGSRQFVPRTNDNFILLHEVSTSDGKDVYFRGPDFIYSSKQGPTNKTERYGATYLFEVEAVDIL